MPAYEDPARRFWQKVAKSAEDDCWLWQGALDGRGYGAFGVSRPRRVVKAHRYSWELANGLIPDGLCVLHRCDNPRCVNPLHLFVGSRDDNNKDKKHKGRQVRGETHGVSKLNEAAVRELREMYATGRFRQRDLAQMFGIGRQAVGLILQGKRWSHVG